MSTVELSIASPGTIRRPGILGTNVRATQPNTGVTPEPDESALWISPLTLGDRNCLIDEDCFALGSVSLLLTSCAGIGLLLAMFAVLVIVFIS